MLDSSTRSSRPLSPRYTRPVAVDSKDRSSEGLGKGRWGGVIGAGGHGGGWLGWVEAVGYLCSSQLQCVLVCVCAGVCVCWYLLVCVCAGVCVCAVLWQVVCFGHPCPLSCHLRVSPQFSHDLVWKVPEC